MLCLINLGLQLLGLGHLGAETFDINILFIKTSNPALCRQKEFVLNLKVVYKWCSLIDPFPANHCLAFSNSRPFSVLSILTIPLDKCYVKSFENINTWIKVKLYCLKNVFFWGGKKLLLETKIRFWKKKGFLKKKNSEKNFFLPRAPKSPGA